MKESISSSNDKTASTDNMVDIFYFSNSDNISNRIKEDFKTKQNFLLLFANPRSGSQQGRIVLDYAEKYRVPDILGYKIIEFPVRHEKLGTKQSKEYELKDPNSISGVNKVKMDSQLAKFDALVRFSTIYFNLLDKEEFNKGKKFIKKYLSDFPDFKIKILIAGGDGSVLGIVEELKKEEVPLERCLFGAMPFGTGNDLSNSLGFGNECKIGDINSFQRVLYTYIIATPAKIDIWELKVVMDQNTGTIFDVITNGEKVKLDANKNKVHIFKKAFINYFSIGFDARVGFQFEQRRTSTRFCNKFIYGLEAAKRIFCCKKNYGLTELLDSFQEGVDDNNNTSSESTNNSNIISNHSENPMFEGIEEVKSEGLLPKEEEDNLNLLNRKLIFKTKSLVEQNKSQTDIILEGDPVNIICQNIDFYMGGTQNIWDRSSNVGLIQGEGSKDQYNLYKRKVLESFQKQAFDDKKIEFLTYEHGIELGIERVVRGMGKRVYQGEGPFFFEFKKHPNDTEKIALEKVYMNCDGEFYHLQNPLQISVRLNNNICDGQINILKNETGL